MNRAEVEAIIGKEYPAALTSVDPVFVYVLYPRWKVIMLPKTQVQAQNLQDWLDRSQKQ